jgi:cell division protein FtsI/penicillin-binding protein 2
MRRGGWRDARNAIGLAAAVVLLCFQLPSRAADQLYAQSAEALLARHFRDVNINYLVLDPRSGAVLASRWPQIDRPIAIGSLLKPFTAIAYAQTHARFPEYTCRGAADLCWRPRGHGRLDLPHAIAQSCNGYFRALAAQVQPQEEARALQSYGLPSPDLAPSAMAGLGDSFRATPLALARAYASLTSRRENEAVAQLVRGMQMAAQSGTARPIGSAVKQAPALAKTGTAPCVHGNAPGDGFAIVLYPADSPRLELLVRVHSAPGAHAAAVAGHMLHTLLEGE